MGRLPNLDSKLDLKPSKVETFLKDSEVPDDFKDALTFEIMALPMTLPSGHTVDQSTLEKCISNDNSHGREAVDPFTGLKFIEGRRPVLNVGLKARIDMFLLHNSHLKEVANVGRTVGGANSIRKQKGCASKGLPFGDSPKGSSGPPFGDSPKISSIGKPLNPCSSIFDRNTSIKRVEIPSKNDKKSLIEDRGDGNSVYFGVKGDNTLEKGLKRKYDLYDNDEDVQRKMKSLGFGQSEFLGGSAAVETDLMETVLKVMNSGNFIRFTEQDSVGVQNIKSSSCVGCKGEENLYELPCDHLHCRGCLLKACATLTCLDCGREFRKNEPKKFHL